MAVTKIYMNQYKIDFIHFLVKSGALKFGEFTLKSGRKCPYFLNVGQFFTGELISRLCGYYAEALKNDESLQDFNVIFGPAYKGIPLCVGTAMRYGELAGRDVAYTYNRKEVKDHGEGGSFVGAPLTVDSKVVIVDDVMTAGTAVKEALEMLKSLTEPPVIKGVLIAVDRMERGTGDISAAGEIENTYGIKISSIVNLDEIIELLYNKALDGVMYIGEEEMTKIKDYRNQYGI